MGVTSCCGNVEYNEWVLVTVVHVVDFIHRLGKLHKMYKCYKSRHTSFTDHLQSVAKIVDSGLTESK